MTKNISILAMLFVFAFPAMAQSQLTNIIGSGVGGSAGEVVAEKAADEDEAHGLGFWVETQVAKGGAAEAVVYFDKLVTDNVGFYAQAFKDSAGYSSLYAGPKFRIAEGVEIGIAIGREVLERHAPSTIVRNVWVSVDREQFSLYATLEKGDAGKWHKVTAMYKLTDDINVGVMNESFLGTGPRLEYAAAKDVQVWGAVLRTGGKNTPMVAVNYSF